MGSCWPGDPNWKNSGVGGIVVSQMSWIIILWSMNAAACLTLAAFYVEIDLAIGRENMVLKIRDDGKGFDGSAASNGMGLRIMRYRAQCIGASCEVQSNRAEGTIVTCRVPLQADAGVRPIP